MMLMTVCYVQSIKTFVHASPKDRENIKNV
jgi:hypothetical protein